MTPAEQARADVEAWEAFYKGRLYCDTAIVSLISRLTPIYERAQAHDNAQSVGLERLAQNVNLNEECNALHERAERAEAKLAQAEVVIGREVRGARWNRLAFEEEHERRNAAEAALAERDAVIAIHVRVRTTAAADVARLQGILSDIYDHGGASIEALRLKAHHALAATEPRRGDCE